MTEIKCDICKKVMRKYVAISVTHGKKWKYLTFCNKCFNANFKLLKKIKGEDD